MTMTNTSTINLDSAVKIGFYVLSSGCRGPCGRNGQENQSPCGWSPQVHNVHLVHGLVERAAFNCRF